MSYDPKPCGKTVFVTPGVGGPVTLNREERRRQIKQKLAWTCTKPVGHEGPCDKR